VETIDHRGNAQHGGLLDRPARRRAAIDDRANRLNLAIDATNPENSGVNAAVPGANPGPACPRLQPASMRTRIRYAGAPARVDVSD